MSKRFDYFFRQLVTEGELDGGFDELEKADRALITDHGLFGLLFGAVVQPKSPTPNLTVDVTGVGVAYDQLGQRIRIPSSQNVNVAADTLGNSTAVTTGGNERWVSIWVKFARSLSDPRTDGNGDPVYYARDESYGFTVEQGAEAAIGTAVRPGLKADQLLLADVRLIQSQTQVQSGDISTTRRQDLAVAAGSPRSLQTGQLLTALSTLLGYYNEHVTGAADKHPAADLNYAGGGSWAGGASPTNPAATVEAQLDKIITDLAAQSSGASGAHRLGSESLVGTSDTIAAGTLYSVLSALKTAAKLEYAGGPVWFDGTTNPAATVEAQLDKLVSDLVASSGSSGLEKLGCDARASWLGGRTNPSGVSAFAALDKIITDLATTTASDDGAERVGSESRAGSPTSLSSGSVASQLAELLTAVNARARIASAETISGAWTVDNITASGTTQYKTASRNFTVYASAMPSIKGLDGTNWTTLTNVFQYEQLLANATELQLIAPLPDGSRITGLMMRLNPNNGHAGVPATVPRLRLVSWDPATETEAVLATATDASGSGGAYDAAHDVSVTGLSIDVDKTSLLYYLTIRGESGANSVANMLVVSVSVSFTVTAMNDRALTL